MSALSEHLDRYLALRRAVGFKLVTEGRALRDFVRFVEAAGESTITTETALAAKCMPITQLTVSSGWSGLGPAAIAAATLLLMPQSESASRRDAKSADEGEQRG